MPWRSLGTQAHLPRTLHNLYLRLLTNTAFKRAFAERYAANYTQLAAQFCHRSQPVDDARIGAFQADRRQFRRQHHHHQVDVNVIGVDVDQPDLPALGLEPALQLLRRAFLAAALVVP